jgi:hypothetical protein
MKVGKDAEKCASGLKEILSDIKYKKTYTYKNSKRLRVPCLSFIKIPKWLYGTQEE